MDELTPTWNLIQQTIRQARHYLDDKSSEWTKDQQQEVECTIADIEQMLEVVRYPSKMKFKIFLRISNEV